MTGELAIDRAVVRRVMADLDDSAEQLAAVQAALPQLEDASFGSSDVGHRAQAMTLRAAATIQETLTDLDQVHQFLAETLADLERAADLADQETADRVARLRIGVQTTTTGGSS